MSHPLEFTQSLAKHLINYIDDFAIGQPRSHASRIDYAWEEFSPGEQAVAMNVAHLAIEFIKNSEPTGGEK